MAFDGLTATQKTEIETYIAANDYIGGYNKVLEFISDKNPVTGEVSPKEGVDPLVVIWFLAARDINQNIGPIADLVRGYTSRQFDIRYGRLLTPAEDQEISNAIAINKKGVRFH